MNWQFCELLQHFAVLNCTVCNVQYTRNQTLKKRRFFSLWKKFSGETQSFTKSTKGFFRNLYLKSAIDTLQSIYEPLSWHEVIKEIGGYIICYPFTASLVYTVIQVYSIDRQLSASWSSIQIIRTSKYKQWSLFPQVKKLFHHEWTRN